MNCFESAHSYESVVDDYGCSPVVAANCKSGSGAATDPDVSSPLHPTERKLTGVGDHAAGSEFLNLSA